MENYKQKFISLSLEIGALKFGEFQLKSGRISPYFFNMGLFSSGPLIKNIGDFYAAALVSSNINYDIVFGPAYKGIPIVTALASSLSTSYQLDKPFVYNRKEVKNHGEGGVTVGEELRGNVVFGIPPGGADFGGVTYLPNLRPRYDSHIYLNAGRDPPKGAGIAESAIPGQHHQLWHHQ